MHSARSVLFVTHQTQPFSTQQSVPCRECWVARSPARRYSILRFCPSTHPSARNPSRNPRSRAEGYAADVSHPTTRIFSACCACAGWTGARIRAAQRESTCRCIRKAQPAQGDLVDLYSDAIQSGRDPIVSAQGARNVFPNRQQSGYSADPCKAAALAACKAGLREDREGHGSARMAIAPAQGQAEGPLGGLGGQELAHDFRIRERARCTG